ncbi:MAG: VWA domain-containing protein [Actinobacteria bacterium]|nr:VWA domain-containing protein [Actinomycetota bacterium]
MLDRLLELTDALRGAGIPVAVSEEIDALNAIKHVEFVDKDGVRSALAATMIKSDSHRHAFDTLFELYFATGRGPASEPREDEDRPAEHDALRDELFDALVTGDVAALGDIARRAVANFGRLQNSPSGDWYSNYQVMRTLDIQSLLERFEPDPAASEIERRLQRDEFEARVRDFRRLSLAETRRRVAEQRGPAAVARYAVTPVIEDLPFLSATADMAELRKAIRPLARKLATRVAMKRRRSTRGALDIRRTVRHSMSTGGVPFDTEFRHRVPHRPELIVLCDISSSVARFARFSLMLTHALAAQFSRVRSFAFVDSIDEVTDFFDDEDFVAAVDRMNEEADVVSGDGHSDYGSVLESFWETYGNEIGPRATLLILGDARNNYRSRRTWALKALSKKARHTFWLNPEPIGDWDTGDSAASEYAAYVDRMVEVRTLRQLEDFIAREL